MLADNPPPTAVMWCRWGWEGLLALLLQLEGGMGLRQVQGLSCKHLGEMVRCSFLCRLSQGEACVVVVPEFLCQHHAHSCENLDTAGDRD